MALTISGVSAPQLGAAPTDDRAISEFLQQNCADCHGAEDPEGGLNLTSLDLHDEKSAARWISILEALKFAQMPPPDADQPDPQTTAAIADRIQSALEQQGHELDVDHRLAQPAYANLLNHERLFDGIFNERSLRNM